MVWQPLRITVLFAGLCLGALRPVFPTPPETARLPPPQAAASGNSAASDAAWRHGLELLQDAAHATTRAHTCTRLAFRIATLSDAPAPSPEGRKRGRNDQGVRAPHNATPPALCSCGACGKDTSGAPAIEDKTLAGMRTLVPGMISSELKIGDQVFVRYKLIPAPDRGTRADASLPGKPPVSRSHGAAREPEAITLEKDGAGVGAGAWGDGATRTALGAPGGLQALWDAAGGGPDREEVVSIGSGALEHMALDALLRTMRAGELAAFPLPSSRLAALSLRGRSEATQFTLDAAPGGGTGGEVLVHAVCRAGTDGAVSLCEDGGVLLCRAGGQGAR
ncbi:hypothetical protein T484DRAFT_1877392, partial [Baffinella frigidus]